jgi:cell division protein ZapD
LARPKPETSAVTTVERSSRQASLFPETGLPVIYEQPLNERIRNCLRLEHLFIGIDAGIEDGDHWDARATLARILEVSDFLIRMDIKGELIKELEREITIFNALRGNPGVNLTALDKTVGMMNELLVQLKTPECQPGTRIRNDELANQVRQRMSIPGGTCSFDVPALHFWLNSKPSQRANQMNAWMQDIRIVERAIRMVLRLIRESSNPRPATANAGFYQQQLDGSVQCQIVRVVMPFDADTYPEISGGKHRFTVRFYAQRQTSSRPSQVPDDVNFELACCGI